MDVLDIINSTQVDHVRVKLKLAGEVYPHDQYIAAYHYLYPQHIGNDNYEDLLQRRETFRLRSKLASEEKTPVKISPPPTLSFEERCDIILMEFENGNFQDLCMISPRQASYIRTTMTSYYDTADEFKQLDPIGWKIHKKLEAFVKDNSANAAKRIKKKCEALGLLEEANGLQGGHAKLLFDPSIHSFIFYDTKAKQMLFARVGDLVERWKGGKTFVGEITRISVKPEKVVDTLSGRSIRTMIERLPKRKNKIVPAVRITSNMILLKTFKK